MIKYSPSNQLSLENFKTPFEQSLDPSNRWIKLNAILPWDQMAAVYAAKLQENSGRECVDIRTVLAAIIIKHKLRLSDRETVEMISENVYMQYFAGYSSFSSQHPFDASLLVDIRKRMGNEEFDKMNVSIIQLADRVGSKKSKTKCKTKPKRPAQDENNNTPSPTGQQSNNSPWKAET